MSKSTNNASQKTSSTPIDSTVDRKKQQKLLIVEIESKIAMISSRQKDLTKQITDTKDIMRKYREKTLIPSQSSSDSTFIRGETIYCLNIANFFQGVPFDKLYSYLESRVELLKKQKQKVEKQLKENLKTVFGWIQSKSVSGGDLSICTKELVKEYYEEHYDED